MRKQGKLVSRLVAAWTAGAIALAGMPEPSWAEPFSLDPEVLATQLFSAQVQTRDGGQTGLRRLALSAAFVEWRRLHPQASALEAADHLDQSAQQLVEALRPADALLTDAEYALKLASLLVLQPDSAAASAAHVRALVGGILGRSLGTFDTREDLVNGSLRATEWLRARGDVETAVWAEVRSHALSDPGFAYAWNDALGQPMQVDATAPLAALSADPELSQYLDVGALLAHQGSEAELLAEIRRQFQQVATALAHESEQARARLEQISLLCPVGTQTSTCTPAARSAASTSAQAAQEAMDRIAAAGKVLGQIAKIVDPAYGDGLVKTATAWWSLFTAINKYIDAVADRNATGAIFSGASLVLAGNILGVVMTLASLLGGSGPTIDQMIMEQVVLLRQEVRRLHQDMRQSFQRIDAKLDLIFAAMMGQFDRLGQAIAGNTAALIDVQNQLAEQDMRLESVAATILTAIGDVELHDTRSDVNHYIGYADTYGQPIPSYGEYTGPENEFHYAATAISTHSAFVVPPSLALDPGVRPDEVLNNSSESAAFSYLTRLASWRDPRISDVADPYANPSVWNFAAQAYTLLALQNPQFASLVSDARSQEIASEGDRILERAASFSRPTGWSDPTNPIFRTLLAENRSALVRLGQELQHIRVEEVQVRTEPGSIPGSIVPNPKQYDLFGSASQILPETVLPADPSYVQKCNSNDPPPLALTRPSNVSFRTLAPELRFAHYAFAPTMLPTDAVPQMSTCWEVEFVNRRVVENANNYSEYARIRLRIHTRFRWSKAAAPAGTDGQWVNARTAKYTWPETRVFYECYRHCPPNPPTEFELETWLANKWVHDKNKFETSATLTSDAGLVTTTQARMNAFLWGRQRAYYRIAAGELVAANQTLHLAATDLGKSARQLQAYTRLGFPVALLGDDILSSLLFGPRSIPVNFPGNHQLERTLGVAYDAYGCSIPAADGEPCGGGPFYPLIAQPHLDTSPSDPTAPCTAPVAGVAGLPGDPVGDCLIGGATDRLNALAGRYLHHSQLLANGTYVEELPWIASTRATLPLVSTLVRTPAPE